MTLLSLFGNLLAFADTYIMPGILALAFLYFSYNVFTLFVVKGFDPKSKKAHVDAVLYGIGGVVVILSLWGIVNLLKTGLFGTGLQIQPKADYYQVR